MGESSVMPGFFIAVQVLKPKENMTENNIARVLERTKGWVGKFVCGLQLCPFASLVVEAGTLRYVVSSAGNKVEQLTEFLSELDKFQCSDEKTIATTLHIFPKGLESFDDYLNFLAEAQALVEASGLGAEVQLASFHPDYIFAGVEAEDSANFTNRSPYPMLHLLRESMLSRVLEGFPHPEDIPARNIKRLRQMGSFEIQRLWSPEKDL